MKEKVINCSTNVISIYNNFSYMESTPSYHCLKKFMTLPIYNNFTKYVCKYITISKFMSHFLNRLVAEFRVRQGRCFCHLEDIDVLVTCAPILAILNYHR